MICQQNYRLFISRPNFSGIYARIGLFEALFDSEEATEEARGDISNVWETDDSPQKSLFDIEEE